MTDIKANIRDFNAIICNISNCIITDCSGVLGLYPGKIIRIVEDISLDDDEKKSPAIMAVVTYTTCHGVEPGKVCVSFVTYGRLEMEDAPGEEYFCEPEGQDIDSDG
jgi:hypothetical protein